MAELLTHRGSQPTRIGAAVASALREAKENAEEATVSENKLKEAALNMMEEVDGPAPAAEIPTQVEPPTEDAPAGQAPAAPLPPPPAPPPPAASEVGT